MSNNPQESSFRWIMLGLVWLLYFSFGITQASIAPLAVPIIDDLDMTYGQMGFVLGAWQLIYIVTAYPIGVLIDKIGMRKSLFIGVLLIWLSLILRGLVSDFSGLFLSVAIFGFGGPIISIGAPKVISLWFIGNERGFAAGFYSTGPVIGASLALGTAASLVVPLTGSWRGISAVYGIVVMVTMIMWLLFAKEIEDDNKDESQSTLTILKNLINIRNVQVILILAIATFLLNHGLNNWLPTLLQEKSMTIAQAGFWTAIATIAGVSGSIIIPSIAGRGYRVIALAVIFLVASSTTFGLTVFTDMPLFVVLIVSGIVRAPMMPILTLILMETKGVGSANIGAAVGLFFAAAEIGGFGGPFILGILRDFSGSMNTGLIFLSVCVGLLVVTLPIIKEEDQ
jgi:cyanate permease